MTPNQMKLWKIRRGTGQPIHSVEKLCTWLFLPQNIQGSDVDNEPIW